MKRNPLSCLAFFCAFTAVLSACGTDNKQGAVSVPNNSTTSGTTSAQTQSSVVISVQAGGFSPASLRVLPGTTVTWRNDDVVSHTVSADDESFTTGTMIPGATYSITFGVNRNYRYSTSERPDVFAELGVWPASQQSSFTSR